MSGALVLNRISGTTRCHHTGQEKFALDTAFVLITLEWQAYCLGEIER